MMITKLFYVDLFGKFFCQKNFKIKKFYAKIMSSRGGSRSSGSRSAEGGGESDSKIAGSISLLKSSCKNIVFSLLLTLVNRPMRANNPLRYCYK